MKKSWQIFWHTCFWAFCILFLVLVARTNSQANNQAIFILVIVYGAINISLFYINYLVLIPRLLDTKKYRLYVAAALATTVIFSLIKYGVAMQYKSIVLIRAQGMVIQPSRYITSTVLTSIVFIFLSLILQFTVDWFINERVQRKLENERLTAELAFLKSQINPHFLFNSLNSIYSLAYQRSETTPEAILKLSEIMRYMLYECNDNKVDLAKELQYLQSYIDLQKIRFGKKAYLDFEVNGTATNQRIAPLLLIAFIENAFKHGVANHPSTPIKLRIDVDNERLHFYMQNKKHLLNRDAVGGIGLNNVRRRLNLLYPDAHQLEIRDEADTYTCELSLIL
jgi:sensor histidine kinase YesM